MHCGIWWGEGVESVNGLGMGICPTRVGSMIIGNLAGWAEQQFATLCEEAGVVQNKSTSDVTGWDYLIEFSPKRTNG